ncbi:MAG: hypothetical protein U9N61_02920 [Euryarchaeota archaeon]|nr:hypothetical protein [Euryarchaeota archaeon]
MRNIRNAAYVCWDCLHYYGNNWCGWWGEKLTTLTGCQHFYSEEDRAKERCENCKYWRMLENGAEGECVEQKESPYLHRIYVGPNAREHQAEYDKMIAESKEKIITERGDCCHFFMDSDAKNDNDNTEM